MPNLYIKEEYLAMPGPSGLQSSQERQPLTVDSFLSEISCSETRDMIPFLVDNKCLSILKSIMENQSEHVQQLFQEWLSQQNDFVRNILIFL